MLFLLAPLLTPPSIGEVSWIAGPRVAQYEQAELRVSASGAFSNPYDPREAALDAVVTLPSGKKATVPGFWYRPYRRRLGKGSRLIAYANSETAKRSEDFDSGEMLEPAGEPEWRLRFAPSEPGTHKIELVWKTASGASRKSTSLDVSPGKGGFVRANGRYFTLDDGSPFWPIGANLGWGGARGTYDFDDWIPAFSQAGANWGRVWLGPSWTTFALEKSAGKYDEGDAWRLDYALDLARKQGMRLSLCIESYNTLRDRINWPEWERSPLNKALGGPLANPPEFWTNEEADRLFRMKLRYLVARYGSSTAVMNWEFWNEVDGTTGYDAAQVGKWHARMAVALKEIDPYRHLITTSFGGHGASAGDKTVFALPEIDFSQSHSYEAPDIPYAIVEANRRLATLGKPHFTGEVGADTTGPRSEDDPNGMQVHDALWASLAAGDAGSAMSWWWDSYLFPRKLYRLFEPLRSFTKDIDFPREDFKPSDPVFLGSTKAERRDISIPVTTPGFSPSPENKPRVVRITPRGVEKGLVLAPLQQGVGNHPELHNPVTFELDLPWSTKIVTEVGDVSGYGGAALSITLDGKEVLRKEFADKDEGTTTLKQYAGDYTADVPAGKHTVTVSNPGQDWFVANFRIVGAEERTTPPLVGWGLLGKTKGIFWVRHEDWTWRNVAVRKRIPKPVVGATVQIEQGPWSYEIWNTTTGAILRKGRLDGTLALPEIASDLAIKLRRVGSASGGASSRAR